MNEQKITKKYSSAIKQAAIEGIAQGLYSKSETARLYGIDPATIHHWIKRAKREELLNKVVKIQMPEEIDVIKKLKQEKHKLESALAQAHLKIIALESTIKVMEEKTGKEIKKNRGTK